MKSHKKEVIIIGGANGSGKTTFAKKLLKSFNYSYLNADEIAKKLNPNDLTKAKISAGKEFFKQLDKLVLKNKSIIIESTLSGKYLIKLINELKNKDYIISIFFILVSAPQECLHRIKQRVLKGDHNIPEEDIFRRFYRGRTNFWGIYRFLVHSWYIIDNSSFNFEDIALGINNDFKIVNEKLFRIYRRGIRNIE